MITPVLTAMTLIAILLGFPVGFKLVTGRWPLEQSTSTYNAQSR